MPSRHVTFQAIGAPWRIDALTELDAAAWNNLLRDIDGRIRAFDAVYSRFRADSLVTHIAQQPGTYQLPGDGYALLELYHRLYKATEGKVTPLIGQVMADAGYDATYSLQPKALHSPPAWDEVLRYDQTSLTVSQPVLLDFGAAGKGYLVDLISDIIEQAGITQYTVDGSGDIRRRSNSDDSVEIGLENPLDTTEAIGIVRLGNQSLCASAGSKRQWGEFHHIIDPTELRSPSKIIATWVIATDTMTADGLATALFFTDPVVLSKHFSFSYAVLRDDMSLSYDKDFPLTVCKD